MSKLLSERRICFGFVSSFYLLLLYFIVRNLSAETLWFDESGQFFISKGLNHFSAPFSEEGSLGDVLYNNARYNHDPGGFSLLLYFWSQVSNSIIWLRLLPFLFFILTIVFSGLTVYEVSKDKLFSFFCGLIPFFLIYCNYPYLLRPYSMELFCAIWGLWALFWIKKKVTVSKLFITSVILSFLMTSRYSAIIITFVYSVIVLYLIYKTDKTVQTKIINVVVYSLPLIITLVLVWRLSLSIQNPGLAQLPHTVSYRRDPLSFFNVFTLLLFLTFVYWSYNRKRFSNEVNLLFVTVYFLETFFIIMSFRGSVPAIVTDMHCGYLLLVFFVLVFVFMSNEIVKMKHGFSLLAICLCFLMLCLHGQFSSKVTTNYKIQPFYSVVDELKDIDLQEAPEVYVTYFCSPTIRYYYEYGHKLTEKEKEAYPAKFKFVESYFHAIPKGKDPLERYKKTELNHLNDIACLPSGALIIGPYKMLIPMDHYDFSDYKITSISENIFVKE